MNSPFIKLLASIANKRTTERNNKTLLVDGIEYIVYMDTVYFSLVPVNEEIKRWHCISIEDERAEVWLANHKSIRVLDWS